MDEKDRLIAHLTSALETIRDMDGCKGGQWGCTEYEDEQPCENCTAESALRTAPTVDKAEDHG